MTRTLAHIWRHPIKGIGSESVQSVEVTPDAAIVGDRAWAFLNSAGADSDDWQPRRNYVQVASGPRLASVGCLTTPDGVLLTHPDRAPITITPETGSSSLTAWIGDLWPQDRPGPTRLIKAPVQGMTDVPYASVSIGNLASLRALSQKAGMSMDMRRFRINLWIDGLAPWEEIDLLKSAITLGSAKLNPVEPIERCRAPDANPQTGIRDVGILQTLEQGWNTRNFGVYFKVSQAGTVAVGDPLT